MDFLITIIISILVIYALMYLAIKSESKNKTSNVEALDKALDGLNQLVSGMIYRENESKIIYKHKIQWQNKGQLGCVTYLCKTNSGNWFNLEIEVVRGKITKRNVNPELSRYAMDVLSSDLVLYREHFGEPETA